MPTAAIPRYLPEKLLSDASPALRFGMYLRLWGVDQRSRSLLWETHDIVYRVTGRDHRERAIPQENKGLALDAACKLTPSDHRMMQALAQRQQAFAHPFERSGTLLTLKAEAVAPFTTGLGNEHPLENGFAFLSPYGLPYLPGSGVKGVVRQAAQELASGEWSDTSGWDLSENYVLRIGKEGINLSLVDVLFGRETPSGETGHVRGALSFWDVYPQIDGERLVVEVMTPHQGHYYQGGATPHESGSPNPITFLTVPPKSRFTFFVLCDRAHLRHLAPSLEAERWKGLVEAAFAHAFEWLGFGAKTSVGYGAFRPAARPAETDDHPTARTPAAKPRARQTQPQRESIWERAQLQFNPRNGTLTATGPGNAKANAFDQRAQELLSRLPAEIQGALRANRRVPVVARVRDYDLIDVEVKT
jgi:CRISPR-associated protein Cmr6